MPPQAIVSSRKSDIQKMVKAVLDPIWVAQSLTKDEYTDVNRSVSRLLYDKIGITSPFSSDARVGWKKIASDEVEQAIQALKKAQAAAKAASAP